MGKQNNKLAISLVTSLILANNLTAQDINSLDKLTVTAQKVEENIQEVPLSISLFDEFEIDDKNIKNVEELSSYTPNLHFSDNGDVSPVVSIRGIFSNSLFSTSATLFIDGVPITSKFGYKEILEDIKRVEVLKGPQGTLYGKDTHGGAINVITKKPTNETKSKIGIELGSDEKKEYKASISGAIIKDKLFISLLARHYEKNGFIDNINSGGKTDNRKDNFSRINLRFTPNENLEASLISSIYKKDDKGYKNNSLNVTTRAKELNHEEFNRAKTTSHALKLLYSLGEYEFQSLSSYRQYDDKASCDNDHSRMTGFETTKNGKYKKVAQEFRLNKTNNKYKLVNGLYFDKDTNKLRANVNMFDRNSAQTFMNVPFIKGNEDGKSIGVFTHLDYQLNNRLSLIGGLRYDKDEKTLKSDLDGTDLTNDYSALSPKFAIEYKLNKNSMIYSTIAKGYRSGGYYSFAPTRDLKKYDKETLISYEIGNKNILLDEKLIINTAFYYMDIDDMQVETRTALAQGYISNAAKATSKGFELDANYRLSDNITLSSAIGYNSTKLDKFKDATGDYSGKYNPNAPKYNYNIGIKYRDPQGIYASADINGYGKTYLTKDNKYSRDPYDLVNIKIGHETDNYDIYLYGKNIFDKVYDSNGAMGGSAIVYSEPREVGIQLAYRF